MHVPIDLQDEDRIVAISVVLKLVEVFSREIRVFGVGVEESTSFRVLACFGQRKPFGTIRGTDIRPFLADISEPHLIVE